MKIDLTPADRELIVDALRFAFRDSVNNIVGDGRKTDEEFEEECRDLDAEEKKYARVIEKVRDARRLRSRKVARVKDS